MAKRLLIPRQLRVSAVQIETKVLDLVRVYRVRSERVRTLLLDMGLDPRTRAEYSATLAKINLEIDALNKTARSWSQDALTDAYLRGQGMTGEIILRQTGTDALAWNAALPHRAAIDALWQDTAATLLNANESMRQKAVATIRRTQLATVQELLIRRSIGEGLERGLLRRDVSDEILRGLLKDLDDGKIVRIKGRNYQADKYSDLVARTMTKAAVVQGNINQGAQYGVDLYYVTQHTHPVGTSDPCDQYAGRTFSISGKDPDFPKLRERPPFHPNCKHTLVGRIKQTLKDRGTLGKAIERSNEPVEVAA